MEDIETHLDHIRENGFDVDIEGDTYADIYGEDEDEDEC
jgi:biotin operon repressor